MRLPAFFQRIIRWFRGLLPIAEKEAAVPPDSAGTLSPAPTVGITFYTVYIPTLDGRFDYLSTTDYPPGEIVVIPFGPEDREILGIVEASRFYPYGKQPLPLWKMKYILDIAPEPIAAEYRRLKKS